MSSEQNTVNPVFYDGKYSNYSNYPSFANSLALSKALSKSGK